MSGRKRRVLLFLELCFHLQSLIHEDCQVPKTRCPVQIKWFIMVYHGLSSFSPLKLPKLEVLILGSWRNPVHVAVLWCSLYLYPHLEVPPNHPRLDFFDIKTYGFGGTPILRNLHFIISFWSIPESAESRFRGGCSFLRSSSARAFSSASFCWAKRFFPSRALRRADDMGTWASTRKWKMWRESIIIGCNWWN